jgi:hypothetical protein
MKRPSVMVSDSFGIVISVAMVSPAFEVFV